MVVFVAGGTGYIGRALIPPLLGRGHQVRCLVRPGSENKVPAGVDRVQGNALDASTFEHQVGHVDAYIQLVGTPNPNPKLAVEFERVDLVSVRESALAASHAGARHFVYVSVAQPAPIMQAYISVRARGEALVAATGIPSTVLRPWYVLGPGHRWPYLLLPFYGLWWLVPSKRDTVRRLGLVTLGTIVQALIAAIEHPPAHGQRIWDVPEMRTRGSKR